MLSIPRIGLNKSSVNNAQRSWPYGGDEEKAAGCSDIARINERTMLALHTRPCAGTHRAAPRVAPPPRVRGRRLARRKRRHALAGRAASHRAAHRRARPPRARYRRPGADSRCPRPPALPFPCPSSFGFGLWLFVLLGG